MNTEFSKMKGSNKPHNSSLQDLDINNYSLEELYNLFGIEPAQTLTDSVMKSAKQVVLKTHPDKSHLDPSYFLFFSKAYKRLYGLYEFGNKSSNKKLPTEDFGNERQKGQLLNTVLKSSNITEPKEFNKWFNAKFDEHRIDNPCEDGHGEWLKSDDSMIKFDEPVTKTNMNEMFERQKKRLQSVTVYTGVIDSDSSTLGASFLGSGTSSSQYTDLKQAFTETLIPVTEDDYNNMPKYNSIDEYTTARRVVDNAPINYANAQSILDQQNKNDDQECARTAFKLAQQLEKAKKQQSLFWGSMNRIA